MSGSYGPKIGQNGMKYDILALFGHFHIKKDKNDYFLVVLFYGVFWENMSHLTYFFGSLTLPGAGGGLGGTLPYKMIRIFRKTFRVGLKFYDFS